MTRPIVCRALLLVALVCGVLHSKSALFADEPEAPSGGAGEEVSGRLRPNSSPQNRDAPYVVLDRWGAIQYFVKPPAGANMEPLLNQEVFLHGTRQPTNGDGHPVLEVQRFAQRGGRPVGPAPRAQRAQRFDERSNDRFDPNVQPAGYAGRMEQVPPGEMVGESVPHNHAGHDHGDHAHGQEPRNDMTDYEQFENQEQYEWNQGPQDDWCGGCGRESCSACCGNACGPPGMFWVRAEYLYWWTKGMYVPPLVTTGPSADQPGYLNTPGTTILFGDQRINGDGRSGFRLTTGAWLDPCQTVGIEGDYYWLEMASTSYGIGSGGNPIISRPFFDLSPTQADPSQIVGENVEQVASPNSISGSVGVNAQTRFQAGGIRLLFNLCCSQNCFNSDCFPSLNGPGGRRVDLMIGYRYARLSDNLSITENLTSLQTANPGSFVVYDQFTTQNIFNGAELGTMYTAYRGRWMALLWGKMALGNVHQLVNIAGLTATTQGGLTTTDTGGLLAQSTNIGNYSRNEFGVMPELAANLAFSITPRMRVIAGYTFVYLSTVVRPGDQIDLDVNSRLLPNDTRPPAGDMSHPKFVFRDSDFWAQGLNVGLDYRW